MIRFLGEFVYKIAQACRLSCTVASLELPSFTIAVSLEESVASIEKLMGWQCWSVVVLHQLPYINAEVTHCCKKPIRMIR